MENNSLPPIDCNLHMKKDWNARNTLVVYPFPLPPVGEVLYVHANLQVKLECEKHPQVLLLRLTSALLPLLIKTAKEFQGLFDTWGEGGVL